MAYERKFWLNKNADGTIPKGAIPISADNLNMMEAGIDEAVNRVAIGEFLVSGDAAVNLGYKPRYLTAISNSGKSSFSLFQNTTINECKLTDEGFVVGGTIDITNINMSEHFDISNGTYYFAYDGTSNAFASNNNKKDLPNTEATTALSAKFDMGIEFKYGYSSESSYDKFYLRIEDGNGNAVRVIEDGASGTTSEKTFSGTIRAGQRIVFRYKKDQSNDKNLDQCYFKDMKRIGVEGGTWSYMAIK